jgi:hypothetical protein
MSIYDKLVVIFETFNIDGIDRALDAMAIIASLSEEIATPSYILFQIIIRAQATERAPVTQDYHWKMREAARLAMHGAFRWDRDGALPLVEDPRDIYDFLNLHFTPTASGIREEPVKDAFRALTSVSGPAINRVLDHFDPTKRSFVHGIMFAFRGDRSPQLRKAAFFFLPLIADKWFNSPTKYMESEDMDDFCEDWASALDDAGAIDEVLRPALVVFFNMMNSTQWRPHIVAEQWGLLEHFILDTADPEPLRRCLSNVELIDEISNAENPGARVLWLVILWLKYEQLTPGVQQKLEAATKKISEADFNVCLSAVESGLTKSEHKWKNMGGMRRLLLQDIFIRKNREFEQAQKFMMTLRQVSH